MKYVITGVKDGQQVAATFETKTTRKSKLLKRLNEEWKKTMGYSLSQLEHMYIGKLDKHTKLK